MGASRTYRTAPCPTTPRYGYARVSTIDQDLTLQREALERASCVVIRKEKVTGTSRQGRTSDAPTPTTVRPRSAANSIHPGGIDVDVKKLCPPRAEATPRPATRFRTGGPAAPSRPRSEGRVGRYQGERPERGNAVMRAEDEPDRGLEVARRWR